MLITELMLRLIHFFVLLLIIEVDIHLNIIKEILDTNNLLLSRINKKIKQIRIDFFKQFYN